MSDVRRRAVRRAFLEIAELPVEDRAAAIQRICGHDPQLRAEVEALLRADVEARGFMAAPTVMSQTVASGAQMPADASAMTADRSNVHHEGEMIGRYKLLQPIGEGGFGIVWMAEQREPVKRRVALKVVKLGMDTRQVIARFEAERQALAMMDHPNIAKVLDAGSTDTGRPYFVMEYIKGVPILEYCDASKLDTRARLELFSCVCNAIQHAHQKGVIHRDIKPSNVLVTMHDGVPVPKVIDFGIAKATSAELTNRTLFTEHRQMIGTPAYMSPEQVEMSGLDIDTRSDIYSLGVLLYELLTGTTPFDSKSLLQAGYAEMMRIIREVEPARPSTRLSSLGATGTQTAQQRLASDPKKLSSILRGDLDWIVMKCLEKDRTRRYETASSLASDIQRHLCDEPVTAGPPSASYKLRKYVRRHRLQVLAGSAVLAALVLGIVGTSIGMLQASQSALAERAAKVEAEARRAEAERNLAFAKNGNDILGSVFASLDPGREYDTVADFRGALGDNIDNAAAALDHAAIGEPLEAAAMQHTLGVSLHALGAPRRAVALLEKVLATRERELGPDAPATLIARSDLARALHAAGEPSEALPLFQATFEMRRMKLGIDHADTLTSMNQLARCTLAVGNSFAAEKMAEEALHRRRALLGANHTDTLASMSLLADVYMGTDRAERALPLIEEAYRTARERLGLESIALTSSADRLAICYERLKRTEQAILIYEESLRVRRAKLGRDHPSTLLTMGNLAIAYQRAGKPDLALLLYEETFKLRDAKLGHDHPETLGGLSHLYEAYWQAGQHDQALRLSEEHLALRQAKFGPGHPDSMNSMLALAQRYRQVGGLERARSLFEAALSLRTEKLGSAHEQTLEVQDHLCELLLELREFDAAEPLLLDAVRKRRERVDNQQPAQLKALVQTIDQLIYLYGETDKPTETRAWQDQRTRLMTR